MLTLAGPEAPGHLGLHVRIVSFDLFSNLSFNVGFLLDFFMFFFSTLISFNMWLIILNWFYDLFYSDFYKVIVVLNKYFNI